jgi:PKD repeat protein
MIYPPAVNAAFTVDTDRGCEPLDVQFTAVASAYTEIYTYEWDFGDGSTGTGSAPIHLYDSAGTYYVKMTARGEGGEDYEYRTIRVYKNPKANFIYAPREATLNTDLQARVEFFNTSVCADTSGCTYLWRFGDGNTSTERQLVYNYTHTGPYDVTLIATTLSNGCTDSMVVEKAVTVVGEGKIKFPNAFVPNQEEEPECTYELKSALDLEGYIFHPYYEGILEYELWIYNRWGELIFKSTDKNCGWNGYVDGKLAKQDVYVWKAQGKFTNGKAFELAGDVTLIR